jgi:[acyl-carrier-protein] S-malonyltransferase
MKAIMFAGADAMTDVKATVAAVNVPHVRHLLSKYGLLKNLDRTLENLVYDPFPALTASVLTQIGLYNSYVHRFGEPNYLLGCSLGDLAKIVCAGLVPIESIIEGISLFSNALCDTPSGAIIQLRSQEAFADSFATELKDMGLYLAMEQTPFHCLVSGPTENLEKLKGTSYRLKPLFPYALHSPLMKNAFSKLETILSETPFGPAHSNIVSSISARCLTDDQAVRMDLRDNILGTVRWRQTFQWMAAHTQVESCVNIGPISTLQLFADRIPTKRTIAVNDVISMVSSRSEALCIA